MSRLLISPNSAAVRGTRKRRKNLSSGQALYDTVLLVLLLISVAVGIVLFGAVRAWSVSIVLILLSLCGLAYAVRPWWAEAARSFAWPPGMLWLLLFFLYACVRVFFVQVRYEAMLDCVKIGGFVLAYALWSGLGGHHGRWRWIYGALIFLVTLIGWYALIQHMHGSTNVLMLSRPAGYGMRASGTHMCPNHFANLLGLVGCVCAGLLFMPEAGGVLRILSLYSLFLLVPVNYLTQSRSGWIGMLAGLCCTVLPLLWRRSRKWFLVVLVAGPLLLAGAGGLLWMKSDMVRERIGGMDLSSPDGSVQFRLVIWGETLSMIKDAPWWGHGGGVFRWLYPAYKQTGLQELWARYPHNEYLQTAAEYGLVGFALLALAVLCLVWRMVLVVYRAERSRDVVMASLTLGALATALAHACFDFNFHIYANSLTLALIAGVAVSSLSGSGGREKKQPFPGWWAAYYAGGLLLVLFILVQSLRLGMSYWYAWNGQRQSLVFQDEQAMHSYEQAGRWMPSYWIPLLREAETDRGRSLWERDAKERKALAEQAIALYDQVLLLNPYETDAYYGKSQVYAMHGDRDAAIACLKQVLDGAPNEVFFLNQMGIQLRLAGRLQEAETFFGRAQQLSPNEISRINLQLIRRATEKKAP